MRHVRAALKAQVNKTDPSDARGIAQMMRAGLYRPVHVKTLRSPKLRTLLTHRKLLRASVETDLRATLSNFGLKVGMVGTARFETRVKELVENLPDLAARAEPLFILRRVLHEQIDFLHRRLHGQRLEAGPAPTGPTVRLRSPVCSLSECTFRCKSSRWMGLWKLAKLRAQSLALSERFRRTQALRSRWRNWAEVLLRESKFSEAAYRNDKRWPSAYMAVDL
jgi:hypothetical protein